MMNYRILYDIEENTLKQIAFIHYDSLNHLSFLTLLGQGFLFQLYKIILKNNVGFFAIAHQDSEVLGFALLSFDNSKLMPAVIKNPISLIRTSVINMLKHPKIIIKMLKTFSYFKSGKETKDNIKAEFLAQAIKNGFRSKGLGTKLIPIFEEEYKKKGIREYKFAIAQENEESVVFFNKRGFEVKNTFNFSGTLWNIYVKKI